MVFLTNNSKVFSSSILIVNNNDPALQETTILAKRKRSHRHVGAPRIHRKDLCCQIIITSIEMNARTKNISMGPLLASILKSALVVWWWIGRSHLWIIYTQRNSTFRVRQFERKHIDVIEQGLEWASRRSSLGGYTHRCGFYKLVIPSKLA